MPASYGTAASISVEGTDEIAEITKAPRVFVSRLANRETVLRQRTRELTVALGQQTATGEVLAQIIATPDDTQPVFGALLANIVNLCDATSGVMFRYQDEQLDLLGVIYVSSALIGSTV